MTMTDPIADMLTRIRNAQMARHESVAIPRSIIKKSILEILKKEGFIADLDEKESEYNVTLKYDKFGDPVIHQLKRISKPGLRHYLKSDEIKQVMGGLGISIISTNRGIVTNREAKKEKLGGEIICEIW